MNIFQLTQILLEYNNTGNLTTLTHMGGEHASGKNIDNVTLGLTTPNKELPKKQTVTEKQFPNLSKAVELMKKSQINGDKIIIGAALNELQMLMQIRNLRKDENGQIILPFGKDVRLVQKGNNFFMRLNKTNNQTQPLNILGNQMPII